MDKLVSIIVPMYNAEDFIERCITSIKMQTYKNIEALIVDDGSADGSYRLCENLVGDDRRFRLLRQHNRGVVSARNVGIENASGAYVMFMDADDWMEPDMVEEMGAAIGGADIVSAGVRWEKYPGWETVSVDGYEEGLYCTDAQKRAFFRKMIFDLGHHKLHPLTPWIWNKLYRKELVESVCQSLDRSIMFAEDTVFVFKCFFQAKSFVVMHKPFYHYCYNEKSVCHSEQGDMLSDINKVYRSLSGECALRDKEGGLDLTGQLQAWIALMVRVALNERMRFDASRIHLPEFLLDIRTLGSGTEKIVIYGAGQAGQDYFHQLKKLKYEVVLWVDTNYSYWREMNPAIQEPEKILDTAYDEILVAVSDERAADAIRTYLAGLGVAESKINWNCPIAL